MALRRPSSGMFEALEVFRRIYTYRQLPFLKQALARNRGRPPDAIDDVA